MTANIWAVGETRTIPVGSVEANSGATASHLYWGEYQDLYSGTEYRAEKKEEKWEISGKFRDTFCLLNPEFFKKRGCTEDGFKHLPAGVKWYFPLPEKMRKQAKNFVIIPANNTVPVSVTVRNEPETAIPTPSLESLQAEIESLKEEMARLKLELALAKITDERKGEMDTIMAIGIEPQVLLDSYPAARTTLHNTFAEETSWPNLRAHDAYWDTRFWMYTALMAIVWAVLTTITALLQRSGKKNAERYLEFSRKEADVLHKKMFELSNRGVAT